MSEQERAGFPGSEGDVPAEQAENRRVSDVNSLQRQRAEERLRKKSAAQNPGAHSGLIPEIVDSMLHELSVHQVELEMQNEELRESQMALNAAKERYFDLYDMAPVGYFTIGKKGLIRQANLTASGLFGIVRSALLNQPISQRVMGDDQNIYYRHRKQLLESGEAQVFEVRMKRDDGTQFWAQLTMTAALDADNESEHRAVLIDISERKQAEAQRTLLQQDLQEKNIELERTRGIAEKASQAKSDFLSSMSHELRTPLNAILGFGQLLDSGSPLPTKEQKQSINHILKAGWHLLALINEVLDLTVIEAGKLVLVMEPISLPELIGECESMVEPMAQVRDVSIAFPRRELPYFIRTDRLRFKQVLINLLSNAIKYNRPGGKVTVDCVVQSPRRIRIRVEDTGAGLSREELIQLFQPFNRLGRERDKEEGTGIGLVVCKRLIELMGGNIGVESDVGRGCVFWIELNLVASPLLAEEFTADIE
jgi:PAS domain S-box-containing protein